MERINTSRFKDALKKIRRKIHAYPEISGHEKRTSTLITDILKEQGIAFTTYPGHYGVGAVITGKYPGPVIALRADMDALPIQEENEVPYKSRNPGCMHACGHDMHIAILLGTAIVLAAHRDELHGSVKLVFQPAEEASPLGGARYMIREGFLEDVQMIFGLHMWPSMLTGHIGIRPGAMMAASDRFSIHIAGKGAHAAQPHRGIDSIMIAADIINDFRHIISRRSDPVETATLSIGKIQGGERYNVIAKAVDMEGTIRSLGEKVRNEIPQHMEEILRGAESSYGAKCTFDYRPGYPVLKNTESAVHLVVDAAAATIGLENVHTDVRPELAAEDFAFYLQKISGAFFWLGCRNGELQSLHNSKFNPDEAAMPVGVEILCRLVQTILAAPSA